MLNSRIRNYGVYCMDDSVFGVSGQLVRSDVNSFVPVLVILIIAQLIAIAIWALSTYLGPKRRSDIKDSPFECGNPSEGVAGKRFAIKYYMVTLFFLVFDLESVFIYPWAVLFKKLSWFGAIEMLFFLFLLTAGLVYVWKKGALDWER